MGSVDMRSGMGQMLMALIYAGVGGFLTVVATKQEAEPEYVKILQDELRQIHSELAQERASNLTLTLQMADLQRELGDSVDMVESAAVFAFLNRMKRPAWCKRVVNDVNGDPGVAFVMAFLNAAYEITFGVSAARYTGRTDFQIYSPKMAEIYYQNDMKAYVTRDYFEFSEHTVAEAEPMDFAKWWVRIPSGTEYVCGLEVG